MKKPEFKPQIVIFLEFWVVFTVSSTRPRELGQRGDVYQIFVYGSKKKLKIRHKFQYSNPSLQRSVTNGLKKSERAQT